MTGALDAFARFFGMDQDFVAAAAERPGGMPAEETLTSDTARQLIAGLPDREKTGLLTRLVQGDPHVASELRALIRGCQASGTSADHPVVILRISGELRARAHAIRQARKRKEGERLAAERKRLAAEQERARHIRLDAILGRGESVWGEIETEIERRNASGYDKAVSLLLDLKTIADQHGTAEEFGHRLRLVRGRHARKERFIERLKVLGQHSVR